MLPGWLHDLLRGNVLPRRWSITMYCNYKERKDLRKVWFWTKSYPKLCFLYSLWKLPLFLMEKVESKSLSFKHLFFYMKRSLACIILNVSKYIFWICLQWRAQFSHMDSPSRYTTLLCKRGVMRFLLLNYFFNWLFGWCKWMVKLLCT